MSTDEWFESWFDSPLYEQLYANRDDGDAAQLVSWISASFPSLKYPEVLDMGCGRGRHSILLAQKGYSVTGVDLSPKAIRKAREKAGQMGIGNASFETGDMRTWNGGAFNLVCSLFTSFGYFEVDSENRGVLHNITTNIADNGLLIMDYLNPQYVESNLKPEEIAHVGDLTCRITRMIEADTVVKTITFLSTGSDKSMMYQERVKLYDSQWFRSEFKRNRMRLATIHGDYEGGLFDPDNSPRMLMIVKKERVLNVTVP